ncbi:antichymotrypsin-2-like [Anopheles albimanus]|uniref:Serpin domain-containing protein n=1 Tax=Anopheles albimanus TaxID=7167 RepID=A0A182FCE8_ANOAL|nr:antichymotrypsin-2-like [Anopheles albimanus]
MGCALPKIFKRQKEDSNGQELPDTIDAKYVRQSNKIAIQLYQRVSVQASDGNVLISPLSISACLSLVAMGAGGVTADEILSVLRYGGADQKQQVAEWYGRLMDRLASDTSIALANKLYIREGFNVKRSFHKIAITNFQSDVQKINFAQNKIAAKTINDWVERKTNNKINDLISPDSLDERTGMVLVDAVHFKGIWSHQFQTVNTYPRPFWFSDTESRDVPMMYIQEYFAWISFEDQEFSALELTYSNSNVTMLVLVPVNREGLAALEERLPSINFINLRNEMKISEVKVYLPKFEIDFSLDLNDVLTSLGMGRMFSDSAEFPDMLESGGPLKVSKAIHKAFIDVNEVGTGAAADTALQCKEHSEEFSTKPVIVFTADHPFIYVLMSQDKGVYAIGKVTNPG